MDTPLALLADAKDTRGDHKGAANRPLETDEFAAAMARLGPFEDQPALAVAVSGGADSMALCRLAGEWAQQRGGSAVALTVDHRLRPGSSAEAEQVGEWLGALGIHQHVLPWVGPKPAGGVQERARRVRYELMERWCRDRGVLHLLVGHHRGDQAETVAMRMARRSGEAGLAAMAAVVEAPSVRILRPLLAVPPGRLRALLRAWGQPWIEDPSNRDMRFARTAVRRALATTGDTSEAALAHLAGRMAGGRVALDGAAARLVAMAVSVDPAGYALVDADAFAAEQRQVALAAFRNVVACIGGGGYPPPRGKLERLVDAVVIDRSAPGATLGGCRVLATAGRSSSQVLVCREQRGLPAPVPARPGLELLWDQRFAVRLAADAPSRPTWLAPLGACSNPLPPAWREGRRHLVPRPAQATLPALVDEIGVVAVPHLRYRRLDGCKRHADFAEVAFRPRNPVAGAGCFLAYAEWRTISE